MSMAKGFIQGVLARDPAVRYTPSGVEIVEFSVATERKAKNGDKVASFFDCTAFGKRGKVIADYFQKGKAIILCCTIEQQRWEKDGQKRSAVKFLVDDFAFVSAGRREDAPRNEYDQTPTAAPEDESQDGQGDDQENMPF